MKKTKILLLFCGGTLIMQKNASGALEAPSQEEALACLMAIEPRLWEKNEIDLRYIANIDSTNMTPDFWGKIIQEIADSYHQYDGFVVTHGTDTLAYTASALSWALGNLGKPVVVTGSQIPGNALESDARRNLVNACLLAGKNIAGVFVLFGEKIIRGIYASKISESALNAFESKYFPDSGEIRTEMILCSDLPKRHSEDLSLKNGFDPNIAVIVLTPGISKDFFDNILTSKKIRGIILLGFGAGNIPTDLLPFFQNARQQKIPIMILSQCAKGKTAMSEYQVGQQALKMGVIEGKEMTLEAAMTKFSWAISHFPKEEIANFLKGKEQ